MIVCSGSFGIVSTKEAAYEILTQSQNGAQFFHSQRNHWVLHDILFAETVGAIGVR